MRAGSAPATPTPVASTDWPDDAVEVGFVLGAWGVQGGFKAKPHAADPQALVSAKRWWLRRDDSAPGPRAPAEYPLPAMLTVRRPRLHGDLVVSTAAEVTDRTAAEALRGAQIFVSRRDFPKPAADEYYWVDLIGLAVVNREGAALGLVADLIDTGPHCVLRVSGDGAGAPERLIPFVDAYVDRVDMAARRITVDWGLDY